MKKVLSVIMKIFMRLGRIILCILIEHIKKSANKTQRTDLIDGCELVWDYAKGRNVLRPITKE